MEKKTSKISKIRPGRIPKYISRLLSKAYLENSKNSFLALKKAMKILENKNERETPTKEVLKKLLHSIVDKMDSGDIKTKSIIDIATKVGSNSKKAYEESQVAGALKKDSKKEFVNTQVNLIKDLNFGIKEDLKEIFKTALDESWGYGHLKNEIQRVSDIGEKKAEFWARDQIIKTNLRISDNIEKLTEPLGYIFLHSKALSKYYRKQHKAWDGVFFLIGEQEREDEPGVAFNCACIKEFIYDISDIPKKFKYKIK